MCVYKYWIKSVATSFGYILLLNQQPEKPEDLNNICLAPDSVYHQFGWESAWKFSQWFNLGLLMRLQSFTGQVGSSAFKY